MGLRALGDSAWLFEAGGNDPRDRLALVLQVLGVLERNLIPEVLDVVSSFDTVAVHFDPGDGEAVLDWLTSLPPPDGDEGILLNGRIVEVPVVYGGDLEALSRELGRTQAEIAALHSGADYTVAAIGFSPGFPYLIGLPGELRLPRRATPRPVAAGSVAIAGGQAGIYPFDSQGGWHVIGRTDLRWFDPEQNPPALLKPGDRVRFVPADRLDSPVAGTTGPPASVRDGIEVIEPGTLTTVQDLGRPGFQKFGVSPGGAADGVAARVANRLVGNTDGAAVLECSMSGPVLRFHEPARLACVGWADARSGRPVEIRAGGEIDLRGRMRALRGYVAVSGGIDTPPVLGSRATDLRAGLGGFHGRALRSSDRLAIGPAALGPVPGDWRVGWPAAGDGVLELRFVKGVQSAWFADHSLKTFRSTVYQTSPVSDRMGTRLDGPALALAEPREMVSQPVVAGSVQVPPDGRPIILMAERQTLGGYPQIGHVISADLPKLARAWPGTPLRFREVTLEEARQAWRDLGRGLGLLRAGMGFLR
jgi:KipI family sensor histidine kinase inhibitor